MLAPVQFSDGQIQALRAQQSPVVEAFKVVSPNEPPLDESGHVYGYEELSLQSVEAVKSLDSFVDWVAQKESIPRSQLTLHVNPHASDIDRNRFPVT